MMRIVFSIVLTFCMLLAVNPLKPSFAKQDVAQWTEHCNTASHRIYLNPKQIFKGLYANPSYKGQLLADVWVKIVPRPESAEGREEYESHLKELKKKIKEKSKGYSYLLVKMQFKCESRTVHIEERDDYDVDENSIYKWPKSLADILHDDDITPGSMSECIMEIACKQLAEKP